MSAQVNRQSAELAAVLKRQAELRALETKLGSIEAAIEQQNAKIEKARAAVPSIQAIEARIGDLLALEAAGHITERERATREGELNKEAAKVRAAAAEASAIVSRIHATIAGLEAQRRHTRAAIANALGACREALDAFLMAEAERVGRDYLESARAVYGKLLQLMALAKLHEGAMGRRNQITRSYELFLPAFGVGGHDGEAVGRSRSRLFNEGGIYLDRHIDKATETERERLEALGVALMWNGLRFRELPEEAGESLETEVARAA